MRCDFDAQTNKSLAAAYNCTGTLQYVQFILCHMSTQHTLLHDFT